MRHMAQVCRQRRASRMRGPRATYNLLWCDWRMPELDGQGFYQALQNTNPERCRRVIFLTGDVLSPETEAFLN